MLIVPNEFDMYSCHMLLTSDPSASPLTLQIPAFMENLPRLGSDCSGFLLPKKKKTYQHKCTLHILQAKKKKKRLSAPAAEDGNASG